MPCILETESGAVGNHRRACSLLFDVFHHEDIVNKNPPVLFVCNKCDQPKSLSPEDVREILLEEMEQQSETRAAQLADLTEATRVGGKTIASGFVKRGEWISSSALANMNLSEVASFILKHAPAC